MNGEEWRGANTDTMCVCGLPACRITSAAVVLPPVRLSTSSSPSSSVHAVPSHLRFYSLCVSYSSSIFYHMVCQLNLVKSASVCGRRRGELEAPVSSGQQSPCSGCPISQHRTRALNKLVIIRSTAAAAVIVKMEFQPTWLSWGGGDRKTVVLRHTAPAGGHLQEKYFRKQAFVQRVGELVTLGLEIENWN